MNDTTVRLQTATSIAPPLHAAASERGGAERLLRLPQVLDMIGLGKTTVYAMIKDGTFPQPRKIRNVSLWVDSEVQEWIRSISEAPIET